MLSFPGCSLGYAAGCSQRGGADMLSFPHFVIYVVGLDGG